MTKTMTLTEMRTNTRAKTHDFDQTRTKHISQNPQPRRRRRQGNHSPSQMNNTTCGYKRSPLTNPRPRQQCPVNSFCACVRLRSLTETSLSTHGQTQARPPTLTSRTHPTIVKTGPRCEHKTVRPAFISQSQEWTKST